MPDVRVVTTLSPGDIRKLEERFGPLNKGQSTAKELRFGRHGSVAVALAGRKQGLWYSFELGEGGALNHILPHMPEPTGPWHRRERFEHDGEREEVLTRILQGLSAVAGTPAETYLRRRGITRWPPHSVRFSRWPFGLCGVAQDAAGNVRAVQVVQLTEDGRKASVEVVKRTFAAGSGWHEIAAVRMPGRGGTILCEGIETGLSVWQATGRNVLACLGLAGVRKVRVPGKRVTIARDGDRPGCEADVALERAVAERLAKGIKVMIAAPPQGEDFNDVLQRAGEAEVRRLILAAS